MSNHNPDINESKLAALQLDWQRERAEVVRIMMGDSQCGNLPPYVSSMVAELTSLRSRGTAIEELRRDEGDSVCIFCDNPEGTGDDNCAIECCGEWTQWKTLRFQGESLDKALLLALMMKNGAKDIKHAVVATKGVVAHE